MNQKYSGFKAQNSKAMLCAGPRWEIATVCRYFFTIRMLSSIVSHLYMQWYHVLLNVKYYFFFK